MRKIETAIVTGATGAIGVSLCKLLVDKGVRVYSVCHIESKRIDRLPDGVRIIKCDMYDYKNLNDYIDENIDAIFHLAWSAPFGEGRNNLNIQFENVKYSLDLIETAKKLNTKVFIGAGSQAEYGFHNTPLTTYTPCRPYTHYGAAKLAVCNMGRIQAEKIGVGFIWTRILSVYGPCDGDKSMISYLINKLINGEKPLLTKCEQKWDYLYCDDAANALYLAAIYGISGKTYVVANGTSALLKDYVETVKNTINSDAEIGYGEYSATAPLLELSADISDLTRDTGFVPQVTFDEGIRRTVQWYKNNNCEE